MHIPLESRYLSKGSLRPEVLAPRWTFLAVEDKRVQNCQQRAMNDSSLRGVLEAETSGTVNLSAPKFYI
jgi:hypothetical protein